MMRCLILVGVVCLAGGTSVHAQPPASTSTQAPTGGRPFASPSPPTVIILYQPESEPSAPVSAGPALPLVSGTAPAPCTPVCACAAAENRPARLWVDAEYLIWWMKGASLPPLITTSVPGTPQASAGILGASATSVLFGGSRVNDDARSGGRFTLDYWLDDDAALGLEADAFFLETTGARFNLSSTGNPILARPFFDPTTHRPSAELIAFPGLVAGSVSADAGSTGLVGADALLRARLCCGCGYRLDVLGGYRFLRLSDHLGVTENLVSTSPFNPNFVPLGTTFAIGDRFDTRNEFHGFDVGLRGELRRGAWLLQGSAQVAVGNNHEVVNIEGATRVTVPGAPPVTSPGGLLALSSNIGQQSRDRTVVVPELGVKLGYQVTSRVRFFGGYTLLYWNDVVRAGDQVDLTVNPNLLPPQAQPVVGPLRPAPRFQESSFWTQGISLGIELDF